MPESIAVCMGSACHLREARAVVAAFRREVERHGLTESVRLCGAFCLGPCAEGVAVKIGERVISGVTAATVAEVFAREVLGRATP